MNQFPYSASPGRLDAAWKTSSGEEISKSTHPEEWIKFLRMMFDHLRSQKFLACDWTQLPDIEIPAEDRIQWAAYRQALRDLPANLDFTTMNTIEDIPWPSEPGSPT